MVRILDRGATDDGTCYIVEELVEGTSLETQSVPWPTRGAVEFMVKVARGMQAVHAAGVVHCDLKPANVLISETGEPKISDFGLASTGEVDDATGGNLAFISSERYHDPDSRLWPRRRTSTRWRGCCSICSPAGLPTARRSRKPRPTWHGDAA